MRNFRDELGDLFKLYDKHLKDKQNHLLRDNLLDGINVLSDYMASLEKGKKMYEMVYEIYDEIVKKQHMQGDTK